MASQWVIAGLLDLCTCSICLSDPMTTSHTATISQSKRELDTRVFETCKFFAATLNCSMSMAEKSSVLWAIQIAPWQNTHRRGSPCGISVEVVILFTNTAMRSTVDRQRWWSISSHCESSCNWEWADLYFQDVVRWCWARRFRPAWHSFGFRYKRYRGAGSIGVWHLVLTSTSSVLLTRVNFWFRVTFRGWWDFRWQKENFLGLSPDGIESRSRGSAQNINLDCRCIFYLGYYRIQCNYLKTSIYMWIYVCQFYSFSGKINQSIKSCKNANGKGQIVHMAGAS